MIKYSSILDYQQQDLSQDIWDLSFYGMKKSIKKFIYTSIKSFFDTENIEGYNDFITDIWVGSSLATYFYKEDTDLDIKIIVDINTFKKLNPRYHHMSTDELLDAIIESGRKSSQLTAMIPGTYHPIDAYFYSTSEASSINYMKYDSLYSVVKDEWYKKPKKLPKGLSPAYVLEQAKDRAQQFIEKLDKDIMNAKRDTIDFMILKDYIKNLEYDDLKQFEIYLKSSFEEVNQDISMLLKDRDIIKKLRSDVFHKDTLTSELSKLMGTFNFSDENIVFKLLQRYGYMKILSEIHELVETKGLTTKTINDIYKILG